MRKTMKPFKKLSIRSVGFGPHVGEIAAKTFFLLFRDELMQWAIQHTKNKKSQEKAETEKCVKQNPSITRKKLK